MALTSAQLQTLLQSVLPQYRLERELGRGGMGVVFLATDGALARQVAIKVVHPELASQGPITRRFLAEARMIARLRHPNIVTVHAAGVADGLLYYIMDAVPGESLRQRLGRVGRLDPGIARSILRDLAAALQAAAAAGVVHRDLKPENILLDEATGNALLADFGIARAMAEAEDDGDTGRGFAVGTPLYMSPEQASGEPVDHRSDLYALGVVGYEMLAGRPPFTGSNRLVVSRHLTERPRSLLQARPDCPAALGAALMKALEKHPADRWQTAEAFGRAVLMEREPAPKPPVARTAGLRRRIAVSLAGAAVVVLAAVAAARRSLHGPPAGTDPRHSMLVLPFQNVRADSAEDWLRDGSVTMLGLDLAQWNDLTVVDHARVHDLLAKHGLAVSSEVGLDQARRLAREAGVWTVVLGDYTRSGDSLELSARVFDVATGRRVDAAHVAGEANDVRPLFDALAGRLLDLSGAPGEIRAGLAQATTQSLEAFRAYLAGEELLNQWQLIPALHRFERAIALDSTFGLAYYKLALTRGWLVGANDSASDRAMLRATTHSGRLPERDRTIIAAYRTFLQKDYGQARQLYDRLLSRNDADVDAWYGLGETWFHDTATSVPLGTRWTNSLRAFRHTLLLDPNYALAYEHISSALAQAASPTGWVRLVGDDSLVDVPAGKPATAADSALAEAAMAKARAAAIQLATDWVASQPTTIRAHTALVDAYLAARDFPAAMAEVTRYRLTGASHPEQPFVAARIEFAAGDVDAAAAALRGALDSVSPSDFTIFEGTPTVLGDLAAAANVFAYQGDLTHAARALDLIGPVHDAIYPPGLDLPPNMTLDQGWQREVLGALYGAVGGPPSALRRVWEATAEAARVAPAAERSDVAKTGVPAAVGLFTLAGDSTALTELATLGGGPPPREVRALLALTRHDPVAARRALAEPDSADSMSNRPYRQPLEAEAYYLLGDYHRALDLLDDFEPDRFRTRGFDSRWGLLARVRLLRGAVYEKLGRPAEAGREYREVIAQWRSADPALQSYVRRAMEGLGRVSGEG